jgi:pimeloyl-ACP methyl ester carboxylesterase
MVSVPGQEALWFDTPDGRMAVEVHGSGAGHPVVVCLHGLSANRTMWRPTAERLGGHMRLLLVDLLGRGDSDPAPGVAFDLATEADRVATALAGAGVSGSILAGHSHGAAIAVAIAERTSARGLFLVNPVTPDVRRPPALAALRVPAVRRGLAPFLRLFRRPLTRYMLERRVFADRTLIPTDAVQRFAEPWRDPARALGLTRILADWDPEHLLRWARPADRPVLVLTGAADRRIAPEQARRWAEVLGGSFRALPGRAHAVPEEAPDETAADLLDFVSAIHDSRSEGDRG